MNVWIAIGAVVVGYLFGAVSFTRIVGRWVLPGADLSGVDVPLGSGTIRFGRTSPTVISMKKGPGFGCLTGLADMAKAAVPVLVFKLVFPDQDYEFLVAAAAVIGHNYPVFYRLHGGVGISPYLGGLAVLDWLAVPIVTVLGTLTGLALRNVVMAYAAGTVWLIPWFWWRDGGWPAIVYAVIINLAVWPILWPIMRELTRMEEAGEIDRKEAMRMLLDGHPSLQRKKDQPE
ncbi:MAG: glycerol-3-phosphate acyltransferase [Acidimicrobiia bacterium]|nr:glycerol-3-phosphate acyltransferase [Acidimicrobiia bacterium]